MRTCLLAIFFCLTLPHADAQFHQLVFVQKGDTIPIENNTVTLHRKPFSINMQLHDLDLLLVNIAQTQIVQDSLRSGMPADSLYCFRPLAGMSDYNKNGGLQLMVKTSDHSYWGINNTYNSFDFDQFIPMHDTAWQVTRNIEHILVFSEDQQTNSYTVKKYPDDALYLVYYFFHSAADGKRVKTSAEWLTIKFID
jgi:hypothetical protein